jgi:hypothetical protein
VTFVEAARHPEFWRHLATLTALSIAWLLPAMYLAFVFHRMRARQAALDRIAAETRGQFRRVK